MTHETDKALVEKLAEHIRSLGVPSQNSTQLSRLDLDGIYDLARRGLDSQARIEALEEAVERGHSDLNDLVEKYDIHKQLKGGRFETLVNLRNYFKAQLGKEG